jgi:hypothetical protein
VALLKVAVLKVVIPSAKFLLPVTIDFLDPSPYTVTFTIWLVMVTYSS